MFLILFLIIVFLNSNYLYSSAWGKEKNEFFLSYSYFYYEADHFFDLNNKKRKSQCNFKKYENSIYFEYGLKENITFTFKFPHIKLECSSQNSGFGDIEVGLIKPIKKMGNKVFSLYFNSTIPTGYSYLEDPRIGYSVFGLDFGFLYGYAYENGFMDLQFLYRRYFGYPSDQLRLYFTNQIKIDEKFFGYFAINLHDAITDTKPKIIGSNLFLETDYFMLEGIFGLRYGFKSFNIGLSYVKTLFGRNTGVGSGINLYIWKSF